MRVRATLRLRNDVMIAGRTALGLSQQRAASMAGISVRAWQALERFDFTLKTAWEDVDAVCELLNVDRDEILTEELKGRRFPSTITGVQEISPSMLPSTVSRMQLPDPSAAAIEVESLDEMRSWVKRLPFRQRLVMECRWGPGNRQTLAEVGKKLGVTPEHVRQLELKAFRTLRHLAEMKPEVRAVALKHGLNLKRAVEETEKQDLERATLRTEKEVEEAMLQANPHDSSAWLRARQKVAEAMKVASL